MGLKIIAFIPFFCPALFRRLPRSEGNHLRIFAEERHTQNHPLEKQPKNYVWRWGFPDAAHLRPSGTVVHAASGRLTPAYGNTYLFPATHYTP
jgi:hypothetical protein